MGYLSRSSRHQAILLKDDDDDDSNGHGSVPINHMGGYGVDSTGVEFRTRDRTVMNPMRSDSIQSDNSDRSVDELYI